MSWTLDRWNQFLEDNPDYPADRRGERWPNVPHTETVVTFDEFDGEITHVNIREYTTYCSPGLKPKPGEIESDNHGVDFPIDPNIPIGKQQG